MPAMNSTQISAEQQRAAAAEYWRRKERLRTLVGKKMSLSENGTANEIEEVNQELATCERVISQLEAQAHRDGWSHWIKKDPGSSSGRTMSTSSGAAQPTSLANLANNLDRILGRGYQSPPRAESSLASRFVETRTKENTEVAPGKTLEIKEVPGMVQALGVVATVAANLDRDNYRDSHHQAGWKRWLTKVGSLGVNVGILTGAMVSTMRALGGEVPFDLLPRDRDEGD